MSSRQAFARSVVMLEQLAGVAYIAMVVSRLVGLTVLRRATPRARRCRAAGATLRACRRRVEPPGVGEAHRVRLPGLGTAGYRWMPAVEGDDGVAEVSDAGVAELANRRIGTSADELFDIRAVGAGVARVRFEQRRPFEPDDVPPADEQVVEVRVT